MIDSGRAGAGVESGLRESEVAKPGLLEVLLFWVVTSVETESLSGSLGAAELCEGFL